MVPLADKLFVLGCVLALAGLGLATAATWSPYLAGALIGVLSWLSFYLVGKPIGTSTTYVRVFGMLARLVAPRTVAENEYMRETGIKVEWQMLVVFGVLLGGLVSALAAGTFGLRWVPDFWTATFGAAIWPRLMVALFGGFLVGFGARWADGCTSGHGISGALQLAVVGWIGAICFFVGGIVMAMLLYSGGGGAG
ncbi:MAG TPA: hypothetical protein DGT21_17840 [Armatimonadetes bacterium]|jgi:hypothetical protein|nr:hypothetical protein [Armatimonadota bacterium]